MHNKSKIQNLFLLIGTIAFVLMIYKIGIGTITDNLLKIEWWIIPILCLWILVYLLNTLSGLLIINNLEDLRRIGFFQLYKITLSTFAINTATPMGLIGGEPYKIIELSPYLGSNKATSSVILFSAMHFLAHFIFWMLSITLTLVIIPLDLTWKIALSISFIICLLLFKLTLKGCKKGIINSIFKSIKRLPLLEHIVTKFIEKNKNNIQIIDTQIRGLHNNNPKIFYGTLMIELVARIISCAELYFLFIAYQTPINFIYCILIMAFTSLLANILFFMPLQIGTREAGFILSMKLLGLSPTLAITISIVTRIRELFWMIIGIILIKIK
ncbi:MAG: flippase-like domain-containing protein [Paludibacteraceae bacterium]|nr:flippase-like domain-containing protein [Paludibacteraceae bacterium]